MTPPLVTRISVSNVEHLTVTRIYKDLKPSWSPSLTNQKTSLPQVLTIVSAAWILVHSNWNWSYSPVHYNTKSYIYLKYLYEVEVKHSHNKSTNYWKLKTHGIPGVTKRSNRSNVSRIHFESKSKKNMYSMFFKKLPVDAENDDLLPSYRGLDGR